MNKKSLKTKNDRFYTFDYDQNNWMLVECTKVADINKNTGKPNKMAGHIDKKPVLYFSSLHALIEGSTNYIIKSDVIDKYKESLAAMETMISKLKKELPNISPRELDVTKTN